MDKIQEQIKALEDELRTTKYNKRTQHHIGLVKAKLARLKDKSEARSSGGKGLGYSIKKTGDGTVVMAGFPSAGKSTLLNQLTNAESKTAAYEFTTLTAVPGLMMHRSARIQILDVPGLIKGAAQGSGRGREVISVVRSADLVMILLDVNNLSQYEVLRKELEDANIRLDQARPDVKIVKAARGGIQVAATRKLTHLEEPTIIGILQEFHISNAQVLVREDVAAEQLIDVIEGNRLYLPSIVVVNKIDLTPEARLKAARRKLPEAVFVSAEDGTGIDELKDRLFEKLQLMRVFLKEPGRKADLDEPMIIRKDSSVEDVCNKLHRDFRAKFRFARVWGRSAKFPGQKFRLSHVLKDEDVLQIVLS